jgi:preprotein translocase subunit SecA
MGIFDKLATKIFGNKHEKDIKNIMPLVIEINQYFESYQKLSNDELRNKTNEFKDRIKDYLSEYDNSISELRKNAEEDADIDIDEKEKIYNEIDQLVEERDKHLEDILNELLPEAFAVVKETARRFKDNTEIPVKATDLDRDLAVGRDHIEIKGDSAVYKNTWMAAGNAITWDMVHYDVQLVGGVVLHQGKIAEMKTGEGKTLVSTLPVYLNALAGLGVHLVTVNNYLSVRDSEWMGTIFNFLGLTVDCIDKYKPHSPERIAAYKSDITYGTNNEFGFDYLRDNMVRNPNELVQRKHHYAIVDEVDSVLVDDARTPLIISGPVESTDEQEFYALKPRVHKLYEMQRKKAQTFLSDAKRMIGDGKDGPEDGGLALLRAHRALPKFKPLIKYLSEPGIKQILQKTENFYLQDQAKNMPKVDEELFFTIDEKSRAVELQEKGVDLITQAGEDPNLFLLPDVGAEIAEIDAMNLSEDETLTRKDQLMQDFAVKSEKVHSLNQLLKAYTLFEKDIEYVVMDGKVKIVDENTGRIMDGRRYSDGLHQAIEAKENVKVEKATQTFATVTLQNYFRMYHKLSGMTGTAATEANEFWEIYKLDVVVIPTNRPIARKDEDDLVYKTKREKYNAIIDETENLVQQGRPVLVGTTNVEVSELLSRMLSRKNIKHQVLNAKRHAAEADIVAEAGKPGTVTIATNMAGRGTDIKINDQVKKAGGLAILGSERHESRRIDNQLRGRAGRQGDPGSSIFYVSLEDDLMRLFGSERIARVMDRFGYEEGEVIQHSMITNNIAKAQKKIEENNFGIRKRLLEYDDVMNTQREVIYKKRHHALFGERLSLDISNTFYNLAEELVSLDKETGDYENFKLNVIRFFSVNTSITEDQYIKEDEATLANILYQEAQAAYRRKSEHLMETALPVLLRIKEDRAEVKNVVMPITDGKKGMNVLVPLDQVDEGKGKAIVTSIEKNVTLALIDEAWKDHLRQMDSLKKEVQTATYEQKDPLLIYKLEAYKLFSELISDINREITAFLMKANLPARDPNDLKTAQAEKRTNLDRMKAGRDDSNSVVNPRQGQAPQQEPQQKAEPVRVEEKIGRNDPCPCGSGKKYKKCHGANA